jgi:site-specific DNA-adenine methylase
MQYVGSKYRLGRYLVPIILMYTPSEITRWYDVFTGGGNMFFHIPQHFERYGIDIDCEVIEALKQIQRDPTVFPKSTDEFTQEDYYRLKNDITAPKWLRGYVKHVCSYRGIEWAGYSHLHRDGNRLRDKIRESYKLVLKQQKYLQGVKFICADYREIEYKAPAIIYADPPYSIGNDSKSLYGNHFDWQSFLEWVQQMANKGFYVFFSDYGNYHDLGFKLVFEKRHQNNLSSKGKFNIEKLWFVKPM